MYLKSFKTYKYIFHNLLRQVYISFPYILYIRSSKNMNLYFTIPTKISEHTYIASLTTYTILTNINTDPCYHFHCITTPLTILCSRINQSIKKCLLFIHVGSQFICLVQFWYFRLFVMHVTLIMISTTRKRRPYHLIIPKVNTFCYFI